MLNKVHEATIFFWVVKIMATTVGETVSDYFNTLGTAAGDLLGEEYIHSFWKAALIFSATIAVTVAHFALGLNGILAFWFAYIVTRPLGASIGDYLSAAKDDGGRNLGTTVVSAVFLVTIVAVVGYLSVTKADVIKTQSTTA